MAKERKRLLNEDLVSEVPVNAHYSGAERYIHMYMDYLWIVDYSFYAVKHKIIKMSTFSDVVEESVQDRITEMIKINNILKKSQTTIQQII